MVSEPINEKSKRPMEFDLSAYNLNKKYNYIDLIWIENMLILNPTNIKPKIYTIEPTDIGIKWNYDNIEFILEINMNNRVGIFYGEDFITKKIGMKKLNLTKDKSWKFVADVINFNKMEWKHILDIEPIEYMELQT